MSGSFESFSASALYCSSCRKPMAVQERLLLVLPGKEIYDYLCTGCGSSLGQREVPALPGDVPPFGTALPHSRRHGYRGRRGP
ncbi:protein of unknown function [Methylacidimicrobium sp. AP8]|uniref:hypothetical protein n=1 Tax=Methylacidimicrobium sp. AP8 TaxID=2730359 RepID=UPI0018BFFE70|nr:hypothetical protein [Methylacidimicrobium sp. AP8]CAB4242495.1 protein of unknown function [Methylacidimicrobium sp. AP8]